MIPQQRLQQAIRMLKKRLMHKDRLCPLDVQEMKARLHMLQLVQDQTTPRDKLLLACRAWRRAQKRLHEYTSRNL